MRIYNSYIIKTLILAAITICISLACIVWLSQALRFIDLMINKGLPVGTYLYMVVLLLPYMFNLILPIGLLCACIFVYNKLANESELVVLKSAGLSRFAIARPAIITALIFVGLALFISLKLMPYSYGKFKTLQDLIKNSYASVFLQEEVFNNPVDGLTVYVKQRDLEGKLQGILVHDNRKPERPITMMAEQGVMVNKDTGPTLYLKNGSRQEVERDSTDVKILYGFCRKFNKDKTEQQVEQLSNACKLGTSCNKKQLSSLRNDLVTYYSSCNSNFGLDRGQVNMLYFDEYEVDLAFYSKNKYGRSKKPREMYVGELLNPTDIDKIDNKRLNKYKAEGHHRILWPFYGLVLVVISVGIMLSGEYNRRGQIGRIIFACAMCGVSILLALTFKSWVSGGKSFAIIAMYLNPLLWLSFGAYLMYSKRVFNFDVSRLFRWRTKNT